MANKDDATKEAQSRVLRYFPQCDLNVMEDFIERTLIERRSLQDALADLLAKYNRTPSGNERSRLQQMIEVIQHEIVLRQNTLRAK